MLSPAVSLLGGGGGLRTPAGFRGGWGTREKVVRSCRSLGAQGGGGEGDPARGSAGGAQSQTQPTPFFFLSLFYLRERGCM